MTLGFSLRLGDAEVPREGQVGSWSEGLERAWSRDRERGSGLGIQMPEPEGDVQLASVHSDLNLPAWAPSLRIVHGGLVAGHVSGLGELP